jgi:dTDP-4-amino-4,6-dideoxygalactose transaminase
LFAEDATLGLPYEPEWSKAVCHLFVVRVQERDTLIKSLAAAGIGTGIHYPIPLHLQSAYRDLGYELGDFPVSERIAAEILSLPMFPQLQLDQQRRVAQTLTDLLSSRAAAECHAT